MEVAGISIQIFNGNFRFSKNSPYFIDAQNLCYDKIFIVKINVDNFMDEFRD